MLQMLRSVVCCGGATATLAVAAIDAAWAGTQENVATVQNYFVAISGKDKPAATLNKYLSDEDLKAHIAVMESAFPRYVLISEDVVAQDDKVVVRARFQGTQAGELMGIAPTGKRVDVPFIIIYRMAGGKIAEHWMSIDQMDLLKQLGVAK
jgi:predicted ester cyclase